MKALIIGGNRFFGRHLAQRLLDSQSSVTLLNRGHADDGFGDRVERIRCDRSDEAALAKAVAGRSWDVVVDQICFDAREAQAACRIFDGKTPRFVFTSTVSVYGLGADLHEDLFIPHSYVFENAVSRDQDYGEAKRQAEATFAHNAPFEVVMARFPIVCGEDDYTGRLQFHVDHILQEKPLWIPNPDSRMSYIDSDEAGACLKFLAESQLAGPVNCSSPDAISIGALIHEIELAAGKKARLATSAQMGDPSPYGVESDYFPNTTRLQNTGFRVRHLDEWLPALVGALVAKARA